MGRPTVNPKNIRVDIRLSESENALLEDCVKRTGKTKSDVIINGLTLLYQSLCKEEDITHEA